MDVEYTCPKAANVIIQLEHFKKGASRELGINWAAFVILATLASPDISYLSAAEIIEKTRMNRCWGYRTIRVILQKGLIDSVQQPGTRNQVRALYSVNGRGLFWLTQALAPNGIARIKAFERT